MVQMRGRPGAGNIDIWKLGLDGTGKAFTRPANFNDYEAGVGYGLLLYRFR